jgi:ribosomal protein L3 glutamine methyltransferase
MAHTREKSALRTLRDFVRWGASEFNRAGLTFGHGTDNALDEAFHLVLWALKLPYDLSPAYLEAQLTAAERRCVAALLRERIRTRKPAAYLTGEAWFAGLPFHVDERVLIPRSPIAELIEKRFAPWLTREPRRILDLCAGSGCIGIACALAFAEAAVDLVEIDPQAREVLEINRARHGVEDRTRALGGDLFERLAGERYDLIVSNPPYVPTAEWRSLPPEYQHEPRRALEAGADGMAVVARILEHTPAHLNEDGLLVCEIGGSREEFEARFPDLPATWPEFERGGDGVFLIDRAALTAWWQSKPRKAGKRSRSRHHEKS